MSDASVGDEATVRALLQGEVVVSAHGASPSRAELDDLFRPEDQLSADPETMAMVFDTLTAHQYDSWKDADLYRAIDNPEHKTGPAREAEIAEYVGELIRRRDVRAAQESLEQRLRDMYRI